MLTSVIIWAMLQLGLIAHETQATEQIYLDHQQEIEQIIIEDQTGQ